MSEGQKDTRALFFRTSRAQQLSRASSLVKSLSFLFDKSRKLDDVFLLCSDPEIYVALDHAPSNRTDFAFLGRYWSKNYEKTLYTT